MVVYVPPSDRPYETRQQSRWPVVIGFAAVALIVVGLFRFVAHHWNAFESPPAPPELRKAEVRVGQGLLEKAIFFADEQLGNVTDIILDPLPGARFGVAGVSGAVFLKPDRTALSHVKFQPAARKSLGFPLAPTHVQFLDLDGHHKWAFLNRGGDGWQDASLIGPDGKTLWVEGGRPAVDDMAAGDLAGDGSPLFVVGFNGGGGLRCLNVKNELQWQKPGRNIWHVEIVDIDGNGQPKIVHTDASGGFTIRNRKGDIEREIRPVEDGDEFSVCHWPTAKSGPKLVIPGKGQIWLADFDGNLLAGFKAPSWEESSAEVHATVCRLKEDEPPFLATVTNYSLWHASVLAVFNSRKQLLYEEIITEECASLLALPHDGAAVDDLLVGGNGKVRRYTATEAEAKKK
jgi:hypothetical protein